jgi:hypothetical protein
VTINRDTFPDELSAIEQRLRDERPTPTGDELDRVQRRVLSSARAGKARSRRIPATRLAMISLVSGALLVGGSGTSLALSGISGSGSAGTAQYLQPSTTPDTGAVLPEQDTGTPTLTPAPDENATSPENASDPAQATRQVVNGGSDGRLPFTGLMTLPLLLIGVVMLGTGFLLRARATS